MCSFAIMSKSLPKDQDLASRKNSTSPEKQNVIIQFLSKRIIVLALCSGVMKIICVLLTFNLSTDYIEKTLLTPPNHTTHQLSVQRIIKQFFIFLKNIYKLQKQIVKVPDLFLLARTLFCYSL